MSARTQLLKENVSIKGALVKGVDAKGYVQLAAGRGEKLSLERLKLVTASYKATEGQPMPIRRAKALAYLAENMSVSIRDHEILVGHHSSASNVMEIFPECAISWLTTALSDGYKNMLTEAEKKEYFDLAKYWEGKTAQDHIMAVLPPRLLDYVNYNGAAWVADISHFKTAEMVNMARAFKLGLNGIIDQVKKRLNDIQKEPTLPAENYVEQKNYLEAMLIALQAGITVGMRYAAKARGMASVEKDPTRKAELLKIAETCDWVPANPPRTLFEAIQFFNFVILVIKQMELEAHSFGYRLDILFNPYYQADKAAGRISREQAQELMECFLLLIADWQSLRSPNWLQQSGGGIGAPKDITIGGVTPDGKDG